MSTVGSLVRTSRPFGPAGWQERARPEAPPWCGGRVPGVRGNVHHGLVWWIGLLVLIIGQVAAAQAPDAEPPYARDAYPVVEVVDFFDERLPIPDSQHYRHADYTHSGVGLRFGVDKRLSYDTRDFAEAVQRFEEAVASYPYKAEIWVYLARAYYHKGAPSRAREALEGATAVMPDLQHRVWDPLLQSMLGEMRRRAAQARTEIAFYPRSRADFLSLFHIHTFLEDHDGALEIIHAAMARSRELHAMAEIVAESHARRYQDEAQAWLDLAENLREDWCAVDGDAAACSDTILQPAQEASGLPLAVRRMQRMVGFYAPTADDYRQLIEALRDLEQPEMAAAVLGSLRREILRLELLEEVTTSPQRGASLNQQRLALEELHDQLEEPADDADTDADPDE